MVKSSYDVSGFELVGSVIGNGTPGCFTCGPGETCKYSIWNSPKEKYEILKGMPDKTQPETTAMAEGLEDIIQSQEIIYEGYLEALPDNDPLKKPSYKVIKCISVRDQPETIIKAEEMGKKIGTKINSRGC